MIIAFLSLIGIAPLLFYLVDGYCEKNIKKGIFQIIAFLFTMGFTTLMIKIFGVYFALCAPLFLIVLLIFNQIKNHGMDN